MTQKVFQNTNINITVLWPNGMNTMVFIDQLSQTKDILDLVYPPNSLYLYPFLLFNGKILDLSLTLQSQGIQNGDTLVIYEHNSTFQPRNFNSYSRDPLNKQIQRDEELNYHKKMICLKKNDLTYTTIDNSLHSQEIYQQLLKSQHSEKEALEEITEENSLFLFNHTIVPDPPTKISSDPLPLFFPHHNYDEFDDEDNSNDELESFQRTNKGFLSNKQACHEWSW